MPPSDPDWHFALRSPVVHPVSFYIACLWFGLLWFVWVFTQTQLHIFIESEVVFFSIQFQASAVSLHLDPLEERIFRLFKYTHVLLSIETQHSAW